MMASSLWRLLVIAHRYLGIAVGVLMLMWFASGIVMMYVGFPQGIGKARLGALAPIAWQGCCRVEGPLTVLGLYLGCAPDRYGTSS
jgi:hypothetical protein